MENNIRVARVHKVLSLVYLTVGCIMLPMIIYLTIQDAVEVDRTVEISFLSVVFLFAFFHRAIAKAAINSMPWAKFASIIIGIFLLSGFPIGTIIGIYLILNCRAWPTADGISSARIPQ